MRGRKRADIFELICNHARQQESVPADVFAPAADVSQRVDRARIFLGGGLPTCTTSSRLLVPGPLSATKS